MMILGIESSSLVASVALTDGKVTIAEYSVNFKKTHSQTLLPMLDEIVQMIGLELSEIDAIAVSGGPGSFTGLRIGSATAKGLGLVLDKPLIHVPTLEAMAYNLYGVLPLICPMMDARRNQVYTGLYCFREEFRTVMPACCIELDELTDRLNVRGERVIFLGDGVPVCEERLRECLRVPYEFAPAHVNRQRAASVAALGAVYYKYWDTQERMVSGAGGCPVRQEEKNFSCSLGEGRIETAAEHVPNYLRKAQAERELEEAERQGLAGGLAAGHSLREMESHAGSGREGGKG